MLSSATAYTLPVEARFPAPHPTLCPELHTDHLVILDLVSPERSISDRLFSEVHLPPLPQTHVITPVCSN